LGARRDRSTQAVGFADSRRSVRLRPQRHLTRAVLQPFISSYPLASFLCRTATPGDKSPSARLGVLQTSFPLAPIFNGFGHFIGLKKDPFQPLFRAWTALRAPQFHPLFREAPTPTPKLQPLSAGWPRSCPSRLDSRRRIPVSFRASSDLRRIKFGLRSSNTLHRPGEPPSPGEVSLLSSIAALIPTRSGLTPPLRIHDDHAILDRKASRGIPHSLFDDVRWGPYNPQHELPALSSSSADRD